uniref:LSDAT_euk domain-containing protein n=1 Tax=Macrostomum lignano TaxID=282301 RepID=A0A1I8IUM9_9PLAT
ARPRATRTRESARQQRSAFIYESQHDGIFYRQLSTDKAGRSLWEPERRARTQDCTAMRPSGEGGGGCCRTESSSAASGLRSRLTRRSRGWPQELQLLAESGIRDATKPQEVPGAERLLGQAAAARSAAVLAARAGNRPEWQWTARRRSSRSVNSNSCGNCASSWCAQSRNCRKIGDLSLLLLLLFAAEEPPTPPPPLPKPVFELTQPAELPHLSANLWPKSSHSRHLRDSVSAAEQAGDQLQPAGALQLSRAQGDSAADWHQAGAGAGGRGGLWWGSGAEQDSHGGEAVAHSVQVGQAEVLDLRAAVVLRPLVASAHGAVAQRCRCHQPHLALRPGRQQSHEFLVSLAAPAKQAGEPDQRLCRPRQHGAGGGAAPDHAGEAAVGAVLGGQRELSVGQAGGQDVQPGVARTQAGRRLRLAPLAGFGAARADQAEANLLSLRARRDKIAWCFPSLPPAPSQPQSVGTNQELLPAQLGSVQVEPAIIGLTAERGANAGPVRAAGQRAGRVQPLSPDGRVARPGEAEAERDAAGPAGQQEAGGLATAGLCGVGCGAEIVWNSNPQPTSRVGKFVIGLSLGRSGGVGRLGGSAIQQVGGGGVGDDGRPLQDAGGQAGGEAAAGADQQQSVVGERHGAAIRGGANMQQALAGQQAVGRWCQTAQPGLIGDSGADLRSNEHGQVEDIPMESGVRGRQADADPELEWIRRNFKKRSCVKFVYGPDDDSSDDAVCACGYPAGGDHVRSGGVGEKWREDTCTADSGPTNACGEMLLPGGKISKYVRMDAATDPETVKSLLMEIWGLQPPNMIISVTGGAKKLKLNKRLKKAFKGLMDAAKTTGAWIITGGTSEGVMKLAGKAVKDYGSGVGRPVSEHAAAEYACPPAWTVERQLTEDQVRQLTSRLRGEFGDKRVPELMDWIETILKYDHLVSVYELESDDFSCNLDVAILQAIMKANHKKEDQLKLALTLNRDDIARKIVFDGEFEWSTHSLEPFMYKALVLDRPKFVKIFLDNNFMMKEFLSIEKLVFLYNTIYPDNRAKEYIWKVFMKMRDKGKRYFSLEDVGEVLESVAGQFFQSPYLSDPRYIGLCPDVIIRPDEPGPVGDQDTKEKLPILKNARLPIYVQREDEQEATLPHFDDPFNDLFVWTACPWPALLWEEVTEPLTAALFAHRVWSEIADNIEDDMREQQEIRDAASLTPIELNAGRARNRAQVHLARDSDASPLTELLSIRLLLLHHPLPLSVENSGREFEQLAIQLSNETSKSDPIRSELLLIRVSEFFGSSTPLQLASYSHSLDFVSQDAPQRLLNDVWNGGISSQNATLKLFVYVVLTIACFPLYLIGALLGTVYSSETRQRRLAQLQQMDADQDIEELFLRRAEAWRRPLETGLAKENIRFLSGSSTLSCCRKLLEFHQSPRVIFMYNYLFYLMFLLLYTYVILTEFNPVIHPSEIMLMIWIGTLIVEEIRQALFVNRHTFREKLIEYATDPWNIMDMVILVLFLLGIVCRVQPTEDGFAAGRVFYAIDLVLFFFRLLHFYSLDSALGPYLVMIGRMIRDLFHFWVVFLVLVTGYGIAQQAILFPNSFKEAGLIKDVYQRAFYQIFGEFQLDIMQGELPCTFDEDEWANNTMPRCATPEGTWISPILLAAYIILANVLMLNLLIATFAHTFNTLKGHTNDTWRFMRISLVREYSEKPCLPPPLIIFSHAYQLIRLLCKRCWRCSNHRCGCGYNTRSPLQHRFSESVERQLKNWECLHILEITRRMKKANSDADKNILRKCNDQ